LELFCIFIKYIILLYYKYVKGWAHIILLYYKYVRGWAGWVEIGLKEIGPRSAQKNWANIDLKQGLGRDQPKGVGLTSTDTTKELMSSPKCRSVEVINNPARPGSNHREVNYINYK